MIQSMTGFGKAQIDLSDASLNIELRSLNSKHLDLQNPQLRYADRLRMIVRWENANGIGVPDGFCDPGLAKYWSIPLRRITGNSAGIN